MENKKIIRVRAVQDEEFKNSYWSFDISSETRKAFEEFERQFGIGFELISIEDWKPANISDIRNFPMNIIQQIPKEISTEEIIEWLIYAFRKQIGIILIVSREEKYDICRSLKGESLRYQHGFFEGRMESWLKDRIFQNLKEKEPIEPEIGFIIACTGKFSVESYWAGVVRHKASVFTKDAYILMQNFWTSGKKPSRVILHEIGHLFGAEHTRNRLVASVMTVNSKKITYNFDRKNKKIILNKLKQIRDLR